MIRRVLPADGAALLRLRREALEAETFEPDLIGMAGIMREEGAKSRHKARLWGVYVTPARHFGSDK